MPYKNYKNALRIMTSQKRHRDITRNFAGKKALKQRGARTVKLKSSRNPLDPRASAAYRQATSSASAYVRDPERLRKLLEDVAKKTKEAPREPFKETWAYLMAMIRLLRAYYRREYRDVPPQSLVTIIGAIIYFVSPIDFIPDWIPIAGYLDDAFVVGLALKSVKDDLDAFMQWEAQQSCVTI
jgi:uncharacterized membrane protein YkvA (DUF1232 family)